MEKTIRDKPFVYNEGILHHNEGVNLIPTNIELSGMEMTLVNVMSRESCLRKMAIDGYIVRLDVSELKAQENFMA